MVLVNFFIQYFDSESRSETKEALEGGRRMRVQGVHHHHITSTNPIPVFPISVYQFSKTQTLNTVNNNHTQSQKLRICRIPATLGPETSKRFSSLLAAAAAQPSQPLDLTEDNIRQVLADARVEFGQLFDTSVGMTGKYLLLHTQNFLLFKLLCVVSIMWNWSAWIWRMVCRTSWTCWPRRTLCEDQSPRPVLAWTQPCSG